MPTAEDDREIWIPLFNGGCDLNRLADHGTGDQGNAQADSVANFLKHAFLVIGRDRRIDQLDGVTSADQRCCNGKDAQRGGCL